MQLIALGARKVVNGRGIINCLVFQPTLDRTQLVAILLNVVKTIRAPHRDCIRPTRGKRINESLMVAVELIFFIASSKCVSFHMSCQEAVVLSLIRVVCLATVAV